MSIYTPEQALSEIIAIVHNQRSGLLYPKPAMDEIERIACDALGRDTDDDIYGEIAHHGV